MTVLVSVFALAACAEGGGDAPETDRGGGVFDAGRAVDPGGPPGARVDAGARGDGSGPVSDAGPAAGPDGGTPDPMDADGCVTASETCNGADDDCDGTIDEAGATDARDYFADADGDGAGDDATRVRACAAPPGYIAAGGDCDDANSLRRPGADEPCDGLDNDCVGGPDQFGCPAGCQPVAWGGHGYLFCDADVTWVEARDACRAESMEIVRVDGAEENAFIVGQAFGAAGIGDTWIGAHDRDGDRVWTWVRGPDFWRGEDDGEPINGRYSNWESDQPDDGDPGVCARVRDGEGRWHDLSCGEREDFVCELWRPDAI